MGLIAVLPKIFYADIQQALDFFIDGLGFELGYHDDVLYIVNRDNATFQLMVEPELATKDSRPEIRIATDDIEAIYADIKGRRPAILHPNLNYIKTQPWGLKEFAVLDPTTVCIVFQQSL
jgi:catechol 2,3-dioxygenase-like lactoylglutathione lyase family enzyme